MAIAAETEIFLCQTTLFSCLNLFLFFLWCLRGGAAGRQCFDEQPTNSNPVVHGYSIACRASCASQFIFFGCCTAGYHWATASDWKPFLLCTLCKCAVSSSSVCTRRMSLFSKSYKNMYKLSSRTQPRTQPFSQHGLYLGRYIGYVVFIYALYHTG